MIRNAASGVILVLASFQQAAAQDAAERRANVGRDRPAGGVG